MSQRRFGRASAVGLAVLAGFFFLWTGRAIADIAVFGPVSILLAISFLIAGVWLTNLSRYLWRIHK